MVPHPSPRKAGIVVDPSNFINFILILTIGWLSGWIASETGKGTGLGLFWDISAGILGALLGASYVYLFHINFYGVWGVLGAALLGSAVFLLLQRLLSLYRRTGKRKIKSSI